MEKLKKNNYSILRDLFAPLESFQPMCAAVLEGVWPGQVWVNNPERPTAALLVTFLAGGGAAWCFLAGDPQDAAFNQAVNRTIFEEKAAGQQTGTFLFTCAPDDWGGNLDQVGSPREPASMQRQHHVCRQLAYDWKANLPAGCQVARMGCELLEQNEIDLPDQVRSTLEAWEANHSRGFRDFGFAAVFENRVVAWASIDFVTAVSGDLGFETLPDFRRRGLGSAVAAAALEHALELGIETHWTCSQDNLGSQRSAKKLGLQRERDYSMHLFALDLSIHAAQLAYSYLARGEYRQAIRRYEAVFARQADVPAWAYVDTAQAWAGLGDRDQAFKYLRTAAKNGFTSADYLARIREFQILQGEPEWEELVGRMRGQA